MLLPGPSVTGSFSARRAWRKDHIILFPPSPPLFSPVLNYNPSEHPNFPSSLEAYEGCSSRKQGCFFLLSQPSKGKREALREPRLQGKTWEKQGEIRREDAGWLRCKSCSVCASSQPKRIQEEMCHWSVNTYCVHQGEGNPDTHAVYCNRLGA